MKINFSFCSNFASMVSTCHLSQNLPFAVFSYCAWEAIPISGFSHELANWVTIVMMFSVLSLDIMRPSVFFLPFYASTIFTGKMSRLVFRSEKEDERHMEQNYPSKLLWPSQPWVKPRAWLQMHEPDAPQKPEGAQMISTNPRPPDSWDVIINVCLSHWDLSWFVSQQQIMVTYHMSAKGIYPRK